MCFKIIAKIMFFCHIKATTSIMVCDYGFKYSSNINHGFNIKPRVLVTNNGIGDVTRIDYFEHYFET